MRLLLDARAPVRPPAFNVSFRLVRDTRIAGARPKSTPVSNETPAVNSSTRGSKLRSIEALPRNGGPERPQARCAPSSATSIPAAPPSNGRQHALGQQLPHDPAASRAHRRANAHLFFARRRLREQQVREVDAGDQQHDADDRHHHAAGEHELTRGR